jgi:hypothetical protein
VWFSLAQMKARPQRLNFSLRQRSHFARRTSHNGQHARHFQYSHALFPLDANKYVAREKRQIQNNLQAIAPLPRRAVDGQIMLDVPLTEVLLYALLMARRREDGKPIPLEAHLRHAIGHRSARMKQTLSACNFGQGFATLT